MSGRKARSNGSDRDAQRGRSARTRTGAPAARRDRVDPGPWLYYLDGRLAARLGPRRPPKRCSTASCCCRRRSSAAATSPADPQRLTGMEDKLKDLAEYLSAALPGAVIASEIRHGELTCRVARDALLRVLGFLRDDP